MAKRKEETGPGTFMILVLVFFVLASLILGITTYLGYKGQDDLEKATAEAKAAEKKAADNAAEQTLRRNVGRIASGVDDADNRQELAGAPPALLPNVLDEVKRYTDKLGAAGVLPGGKGEFVWPTAGDGPGVAPKKTIPQIAKEWEKLAKDAEARYQAEKRAKEKAQSDAQALQAQQQKDKEAFDAAVKSLNDQMAAKIKAMDAAFLALKTEAEKAGTNFKKIEDQWAEEKARLEEQLTSRLGDLKAERDRRLRAENPDPSDIEARWKNLNIAKMAERMGKITDKNGSFVNLQFAVHIQLLAGQTFVVIPANRSLVEVLDREKALEKVHHERVSLGPREPFTDNEMIKGMVEVTDLTGADSARARITYETAPIRDPLAKGDQIFNMTLSSGEKEHVALAGIIDLDGDGRPDTEAFMGLLQKNNLIVDSWLDLKTGEIKGKGMNSGTKFLILGTDAPVEVGRIKKMVKTARANGTQVIDSRVFMSLIGVKPPRNAAPPNYASVNLGPAEDDGTAPKEGDAAPMPPPAPDAKEPKKEDK
jgi:hypothetical protein